MSTDQNETAETVKINTLRCPRCGISGHVIVPKINYIAYTTPPFPFIQNAFPMLSAGEREQIMTGYHSACFDLDFPEDEEDYPDYDPAEDGTSV